MSAWGNFENRSFERTELVMLPSGFCAVAGISFFLRCS